MSQLILDGVQHHDPIVCNQGSEVILAFWRIHDPVGHHRFLSTSIDEPEPDQLIIRFPTQAVKGMSLRALPL
jgi:hypothetical protein